MTAYYNEIDPYAAQWLRNLISVGLIAKGEVDERSGWSYALHLAACVNSLDILFCYGKIKGMNWAGFLKIYFNLKNHARTNTGNLYSEGAAPPSCVVFYI